MTKRSDYHYYQMDVKIDARRQEMQARVKISYRMEEERDRIELYLHRNLRVQSVTCEKMREYRFDPEAETGPFTPEAGKLTIVLAEVLPAGEELEIETHYMGRIGIVSKWTVNRITSEWVELGFYTPWFPLIPAMSRFTYELKLRMAAEYNVAGTGIVEDEGDYWLFTGDIPDRDCVIVASRDLRNVSMVKNGIEVCVHYTNPAEDKLAEDLLSSALWLMQKYIELFGTVGGNHATLVIAPRGEGGGYARMGFIVMTPMEKGSDFLSYFKYTAHELGHLWWWQAPAGSWEDWLNESFAEYAAWMAIRERFGEEAFTKVIAAKETAAANLPPVRGILRQDEQAEKVLYAKGPVLLYRLERELGEERFLSLLQAMARQHITSTADFLLLLRELAGEKVAKRFEEQLCQ